MSIRGVVRQSPELELGLELANKIPPMHIMEREQYVSPITSLSDPTGMTDEVTRIVEANMKDRK